MDCISKIRQLCKKKNSQDKYSIKETETPTQQDIIPNILDQWKPKNKEFATNGKEDLEDEEENFGLKYHAPLADLGIELGRKDSIIEKSNLNYIGDMGDIGDAGKQDSLIDRNDHDVLKSQDPLLK